MQVSIPHNTMREEKKEEGEKGATQDLKKPHHVSRYTSFPETYGFREGNANVREESRNTDGEEPAQRGMSVLSLNRRMLPLWRSRT
jgi:hypothetical protein